MSSSLIVGITDHVRPPFSVEQEALGDGAEFVSFASIDEDTFDADALVRLDALLVWRARITAKTVDRLDNCRIVVRYGVGYVESDIQQSEIIVFPPAIEDLNRKVRRVHLGTHGTSVHNGLRDMFVDHGWDLIFDYAPNQTFETEFGTFETNDGVLTVVNPRLRRSSS